MAAFLEGDSVLLDLSRPQAPAMQPVWSDAGLAASPEEPDPRMAREGVVMRMTFEGASEGIHLAGESPLPGVHHYFLGDDPARWRSHVPRYASVTGAGLYDGIDVRFCERVGRLTYDLMLAAGAEPDSIVVRLDGIEGLDVDENGHLLIHSALETIVQTPPIAWADSVGRGRVPVECRFRVLDQHRYGFEVSGRSVLDAMVIDPGFEWSTLLGGSRDEDVNCIEIDRSGEIIVAGRTASDDYPVTLGAYDTVYDWPASEVVLSRLSESGDALVFATYLGGSGVEDTRVMDVADDGSVALAGFTTGPDFPTTVGAFDSTFGGGEDAFVSVVSSDGSTLLYSTLLGAEGPERADGGVLFDEAGRIYASGRTCFSSFPVTVGAYDVTLDGPCDAFLILLDPSQAGPSQLVYSTLLGGQGDDGADGMFRSSQGRIVLLGSTSSTDFPTTPDAFMAKWGTGQGFMTSFAPDLLSIEYSSYIFGFTGFDASGSDDLCFAVSTASGALATPGAYDVTPNGGLDVAVTRMTSDWKQVAWSSLIGGAATENAIAVAFDTTGNVIVTGQTHSANFPTTEFAADDSYSFGCADAFVSMLSADGSQLLYSTYLGASGSLCNTGQSLAADGDGRFVVGGRAAFSYPTTVGAFQTVGAGSWDTFLSRIDISSPWTDLGSGLAGAAGVPKLSASGMPCAGESVTFKLSRCAPNATVGLVVGLSAGDIPFYGGVLVPAPDLLLLGLVTNSTGRLMLEGVWPAGVPGDVSLYFQFWVYDAAGAFGFSASNALTTSTPILLAEN